MINMLPVITNSEKADDERRGVKRKMALSSCDVCGTEEAKYRCPNCMKHTCSLPCVKQHKTLSGCSGVRDKTAFVRLSEFDEMNLLSDYRFLEDAARLRLQSNRDTVLLAGRKHPKEGTWMIRRARAVKVTLKLLPKTFSKHRENSTTFINAEKRFHWHLKIHFPQSDAVYSQRCPDNKQMDQILSDYIHPSESDPVKRQKLKLYVSSPPEDIRVFLKAELQQPNALRFLELDPKKSLQENLMHKTIVEYPEVFVVLKQFSQEYLTRIPDHSSVKVSRSSCSPAEAPVSKKPRVSDELEDGELMSEDDNDDDDDDGVNDHPDETELKPPAILQVDSDPAPVDEENQNSVNITSGNEETTMLSEDQHNSDERNTSAGSPRDLTSPAGRPEDEGAQHEHQDTQTDAQRDCSQTCIDFTHSSLADPSDTSETGGQENPCSGVQSGDTDGPVDEENQNSAQLSMNINGNEETTTSSGSLQDLTSPAGHPEDEGAQHEHQDTQTDAQRDCSQTCIDFTHSSSADPPDMNETDGRENSHSDHLPVKVSRSSCSPAEDPPEPPVSKKARVSDELEDGELRSEEDDDNDDGVNDHPDETEINPPVIHQVEIDAPVDQDNQNSVNITSGNEETTMLSEDQHNTDARDLTSPAGRPEDEGAQHEHQDTQTDAQRDCSQTCIDFTHSSSADPPDTSETGGWENFHSGVQNRDTDAPVDEENQNSAQLSVNNISMNEETTTFSEDQHNTDARETSAGSPQVLTSPAGRPEDEGAQHEHQDTQTDAQRDCSQTCMDFTQSSSADPPVMSEKENPCSGQLEICESGVTEPLCVHTNDSQSLLLSDQR